MISRFILKNKEAIPCEDLLEWGQAMEDMNRVVKQEDIGDVRISTVFLGLDQGFGIGEPLLFETMIFGGQHHNYQDRCSTWEQAKEMHLKAKKIVVNSHG